MLRPVAIPKNNFVGPEITEVEESRDGNEGNGVVKIETVTGADPGELKDIASRKTSDSPIDWVDFEKAIDLNKEKKKIYIY